MGELLRAIWGVACLAAVMSVILARSGFGAGLWLGLSSAVFGLSGAILAAGAIVQLWRSFRAYRAEALTLGRLDHRVSRLAALRFAGLQALAIGALLAVAAGVAFVLPGMAVQAAFVAALLTPSLWAVQVQLVAGHSLGGMLERLVAGGAQRRLAQAVGFWRRPKAGWVFGARIATARGAAAADSVATAYLNAVDSDGLVRPDLSQCGPSVAADARWRLWSVAPVFAASLPFALVAWACAAWLPDSWVPRLPAPGVILGLDAPPPPADAPPPQEAQDQPPPPSETSQTGPDAAGGSGTDGSNPDEPDSGDNAETSGPANEGGQGTDPASAGGKGSQTGSDGAGGQADAEGAEGGAGPQTGSQADGAGAEQGAAGAAPSQPGAGGQADAAGAEGAEGGAGPQAGPQADGAGLDASPLSDVLPDGGGASDVGVAADGPVPPDAVPVNRGVTAAATPLDPGEALTVGSQQALFAAPGHAPDTVETRLDEDATLPPDLPASPLLRQRLPAWISDLIVD